MSPIGRVFVVLNLVLAGAFVGFSGTYLKNHTNWKQKHDAVATEVEKKRVEDKSALDNLSQELSKSNRELAAYTTQAKRAEAELDGQTKENQRLSGLLSSLESDLKELKSGYATMVSKVETASEDAKKTLQLGLAADEEKHKALNAQKDAEAKLAEASAKIASLDSKIADLNGEMSKRDQKIGEQTTLLAAWSLKFPGAVLGAQPDVAGRVHHVSNKLVTIEITDKKGDLQKGNTFSIYNAAGYKADMVVENVDGNFAFGRITMAKDNASVIVGDNAKTNLTR